MPKTRIRDPLRFKTVLCNNFAATGHCPYATKCQFAHGVEELRQRPIATMKLGSTQGLKTKATDLAHAIGVDPALPIPAVVEAARRLFGLQDQLDTLVTLPEKVDLCCAVAALAAKAPSPIDKDARLSSSGVATDPEFSLLQCHECTGKVEAHGSSAPFVARRQVSHATELVRRAISFVLDDAAAEDDILTQPSIWDAAPHVRFNAINAAASAA